VSIVLGIVGMHALNTHGVMGNTDHSTMTGPMPGTHGEASTGSVASDPAGPTSTTSSTTQDGDGPSPSSMVILCFAMLAAAAGALLFLGLLRTPRDWAHRPIAPSTVARWVTARLGTGPPYVWEFSVIRC